MVIEEKPEPIQQWEWTEQEAYVLALLAQQRALSLDHLFQFLQMSVGGDVSSERTKNLVQTIVNHLQQRGLVTQQIFDRNASWIWLSKGGLRYVGLSPALKSPTRASLPALEAANAIRLSLSQLYPQGTWTSRHQLRRLRAMQKIPPLPNMPTAEFRTGEGEYLAIHIMLRQIGTTERLAKHLLQQLLPEEHSPSTPSYTALWYYASPTAAVHLRAARDQVLQKIGSQATRIRIFSYPLVPKLHLYRGHHSPIRHLAWSPDGSWIASTDEQCLLHVWSSETGFTRFTRPLLHAPASRLAWSPDGTWIASADEEGRLFIWQATSGELHAQFPLHSDIITGLAWSPHQNTHLATSARDGSVQLLNIVERVPVWKSTYRQQINALAWGPSGGPGVPGNDQGKSPPLNAITGQLQLTYEKHAHAISTLVWSPDGSLLASASDIQDIQVWEASSGKKLRTLWSSVGPVYSMNWSPNGRQLAWAGDEERIEVYHPQTGKRTFVYDDHEQIVNTLAWSPKAELLASGSSDTTIHVYSVPPPLNANTAFLPSGTTA